MAQIRIKPSRKEHYIAAEQYAAFAQALRDRGYDVQVVSRSLLPYEVELLEAEQRAREYEAAQRKREAEQRKPEKRPLRRLAELAGVSGAATGSIIPDVVLYVSERLADGAIGAIAALAVDRLRVRTKRRRRGVIYGPDGEVLRRFEVPPVEDE